MLHRRGSMRGFVDLHSHWVSSIDDGARSTSEGIDLLRGLHDVGFSTVVATPHMRPGMFENDRSALVADGKCDVSRGMRRDEATINATLDARPARTIGRSPG